MFPCTGPILGKLNQMYGNALFTTFFQGFRVIIVLLKLVCFAGSNDVVHGTFVTLICKEKKLHKVIRRKIK